MKRLMNIFLIRNNRVRYIVVSVFLLISLTNCVPKYIGVYRNADKYGAWAVELQIDKDCTYQYKEYIFMEQYWSAGKWKVEGDLSNGKIRLLSDQKSAFQLPLQISDDRHNQYVGMWADRGQSDEILSTNMEQSKSIQCIFIDRDEVVDCSDIYMLINGADMYAIERDTIDIPRPIYSLSLVFDCSNRCATSYPQFQTKRYVIDDKQITKLYIEFPNIECSNDTTLPYMDWLIYRVLNGNRVDIKNNKAILYTKDGLITLKRMQHKSDSSIL